MKFKFYNIEDFKEFNYYSKHNIRIYSLWLYIFIILFFSFFLFISIAKIDVIVNGKGSIQTKVLPVQIINENTGTILETNLEQNKFISKGTLLYKLDTSLFEEKKQQLEIKKTELLEALNYLLLNRELKSNNINFYTENIDILEEFSIRTSYLLKIEKIKIEIKEAEKTIYTLSELLKIGGVSQNEYTNSIDKLNILKRSVEELLAEYNEHISKKIKNIKQEIYNIDLEIQELKINIKKRTIYSPIDGYIELSKNINKQEILLEGTQIGTVIPDTKNYYIEILISEKDILKIKKTMKIKYKLIGNDFTYKKIKFYGNVLKISNDSIDINGEKFYLIIGSIQSNNINNISTLKKGMTVEVSIISEKKRIISFLLELLSLKNK